VNSSKFDIAAELSSTIKIVNRSKTMQSILMKEWITINQLELSEFYINQNRGRKRERGRIKYVASGVGDFIKNSCVWELLSEPGLPDQSLCCQPSSGSTMEGGRRIREEEEKGEWTRMVHESGGSRWRLQERRQRGRRKRDGNPPDHIFFSFFNSSIWCTALC